MPEFAKVHSWPTCEVNKQILVWFHCDGGEPQWAVPEQQEITKGEWVYRGRTEHFINAHIQVCCICLSTCFIDYEGDVNLSFIGSFWGFFSP